MTHELLRLLEQYRAAGGGEGALLTVVETKGSAYRRAGARAIIRRDRRIWGAISGGCVESDLIGRALHVIESGASARVVYKPSPDDLLFGLGSGCQGEVSVVIEPLRETLDRDLSRDRGLLVTTDEGTRVIAEEEWDGRGLAERIAPPLSLLLFGASPAAEPLAAIGKQLGWRVTIADHRPAVATDPRFAVADRIEIAPAEELVSRCSVASPSAAVVMTHHYLRDLEIVKQLLSRELDYVGLVGARSRSDRIAGELRALGIDERSIGRLRAPAGLDLGAEAPAEIALSIVAEIQTVIHRATAAALRDRRGRIHDAAEENAIVILAAGGSRRLGRPKQLVEVGGTSLARAAAEAALAVTPAVTMVLGANADVVRAELEGLDIEIVVNDRWRDGIASSIRAGIHALQARPRHVETATLMLCDQPGVNLAALERLVAAYRSTRAPVIASRYPEGPGVPALFHATLFPTLESLQGDVGARQLIRHLDREVVTIPFDATADIDSPADLSLWNGR